MTPLESLDIRRPQRVEIPIQATTKGSYKTCWTPNRLAWHMAATTSGHMPARPKRKRRALGLRFVVALWLTPTLAAFALIAAYKLLRWGLL